MSTRMSSGMLRSGYLVYISGLMCIHSCADVGASPNRGGDAAPLYVPCLSPSQTIPMYQQGESFEVTAIEARSVRESHGTLYVPLNGYGRQH